MSVQFPIRGVAEAVRNEQAAHAASQRQFEQELLHCEAERIAFRPPPGTCLRQVHGRREVAGVRVRSSGILRASGAERT